MGFLPTGEVADLDADAVVYATGYRERDPFGLLGEAGGDSLAGPDGRPVVERDYRIATVPGRSWASTCRARPSTATASRRRCCP